jgi:nucleoside-diphosphate-sugar epimerase
VQHLQRAGFSRIRAVDVKPLDRWFQRVEGTDQLELDLTSAQACARAVAGARAVYNLVADRSSLEWMEVGIRAGHALINTRLLIACRDGGVERYLLASAATAEQRPAVCSNPRGSAGPAPGWEAVVSESACAHFRDECGLAARIVRFHDVYGPFGTFDGGREKAPAAICRKVIVATLSGSNRIDLWPEPWPRSFLYVTDAVRGAQAVLESKVTDPVDLAGAEAVTIDRLLDIVEAIAGVRLERSYEKNRRSCRPSVRVNLPRLRRQLGWEPEIPLRAGLEHTYRWIQDQMASGTGSAGLARRIS